MIELHNTDCMDYMRDLPDNAFELAIVDPPYGIGMDGGKPRRKPKDSKRVRPLTEGQEKLNFKKDPPSVKTTPKPPPPKPSNKKWDKARPTKEYWLELARVSKNRIVWGANYFTEHLPPSMGWVYWAKMEDASDFSDGELAYTSFDRALRTFKVHQYDGTRGGKDRIHPTQKPVKLYEWLIMNYAKEGDRILDTHLGSGSIAIACHNLGFDLVGCELDVDYYEGALKRLKQHQAQLRIPD
jgi:site-specific DNA-methyltransferase (adenine-specific)